jgi:hypothetical protein
MNGARIASTIAKSIDTGSSMAPQEHRSLSLSSLIPHRKTTCVSDEATLRQRLHSSNGGIIALCSGTTIKLLTPIDMTKLSFELRCKGKSSGFFSRLRRRKAPAPSKCVISGDGKMRLFSGSPTLAIFDGLEFRDGRAPDSKDGGLGGAFLIEKDSTVTFRHCAFAFNQARVRRLVVLNKIEIWPLV